MQRFWGLKQWPWMVRMGFIALLYLLIYFGRPYFKSFVFSLAMFATLSMAWNLVGGFLGYVSFGHVMFWGIGAYVTAILLKLGCSLPLALLSGGIVSMVVAVIIGVSTLKLSGVYFAIGTLAAAEGLKILAAYLKNVTGGGGGFYLPPVLDLQICALLMCTVCAAFYVVLCYLSKSKYGKLIQAIRDDEQAAVALGIHVFQVRLRVFLLSALFAGLAGGLYMINTSFINPATAFDISITVRVLVMTLLGGIGTADGPIIGTTFYMIISELLWVRFPEIHKIILGILLVITVLFARGGIIDLARRVKVHVSS